MIYIILIAIFKSLADSIKPDQFDKSIFKKWKGTWWDLRARETKYHNMNIFLYMVLVHFLDAWHFFNSCMVSTIFIALYPLMDTYNFTVYFIGMWMFYGLAFEGVRRITMNKNYTYL